MKKINIKLLLLLGCILPVYTCFASLGDDFREAFPDLISDLCASTIDYSLGDTTERKTFDKWQEDLEKKSDEYHEKINCLFNEAFSHVVENVNTEVQTAFGKKKLVLDTPMKIPVACKNVYQETQSAQQRLRLKNGQDPTVCDPDGNTPSVAQLYSACNVAQTTLSELCGYQKYLWAKFRDDQTLLGTTKGGESTFTFIENQNQFQQELLKEITHAQEALENTLLFYQEFEQSYRLHAWFVAIRETLRTTHMGMAFLQGIFQTFPEKFINASTP